jgi:TetR/AcrR family transcriptional regulator, tetracycline repressor protein
MREPQVGARTTVNAIVPSDPGVDEPSSARGRPPSLSEGEIVDAALRLTRGVGLDKLTMRALARELDTPPMTIYHYVPNKEALRELVVDHILAEIRVPGSDEGTWEDRLQQLERSARRVFAQHPGVSTQFGDRGSVESRRLAEGVLAILHDGGFSPEDAVLCFAALYTFMTGQIDLDAMADAIVSGTPRATLESVTRVSGYSRDELFEFGFGAVIAGLKAKLLE